MSSPLVLLKKELLATVDKYVTSVNEEKIATIAAPVVGLLNGMANEVFGDPESFKQTLFSKVAGIHVKNATNTAKKGEFTLSFQFCKYIATHHLIIDNLHCLIDLQFGELKERLISLSLSGCIVNSLKQTLVLSCEPKWIHLKRLTLKNCGITKIPPNVFNQTHFPKLEVLDMSNNLITILENIVDRPLDELIIANNKINKIRSRNGGNISSLVLENNLVQNIGNLKSFFNLKTLDVQNNKISDYTHLKPTFSKMFSLSEVTFKGNPIVTHPDYRLRVTVSLPAFDFGLSIRIDGMSLTNDEKTGAIVALQQNSTIYQTTDKSDSDDDESEEGAIFGKLEAHEEDKDESQKESQKVQQVKADEQDDELNEAEVLEFLRKKVDKGDEKFIETVNRVLGVDVYEKAGPLDDSLNSKIRSGKCFEIDRTKSKIKGKLRVLVNTENDVKTLLSALNEGDLVLKTPKIEPTVPNDDEVATTDDLTDILKNYKLSI
ncbi:hypothetical protein EIN_079630 [Entamoeba invadens IP1]|uniref:hypothetical protein n=1 Tax=Entamoeba invadens IP1 TaxID=370355 RepID=UPI0002C3DF27|nr:hypothetical protein EIN_079630 [Entamoeba invadens IP1]ELP85031.1 hypothetical protein EIN_079630 [Entamoeba invadens IP1]|eukprot:XP_004184377.1 hypothetical protein EIN_079630 [Entamoeba invadens IP1]